MGQKLKIWATMTSIILLSGILVLGIGPDALATHNPKGKGLSEGCTNGVAKNNPHCAGFTACDTNGDGKIDAVEVTAQDAGADQGTIDFAEDLVALIFGDTNDNGFIDTQDELTALNGLISPNCV